MFNLGIQSVLALLVVYAWALPSVPPAHDHTGVAVNIPKVSLVLPSDLYPLHDGRKLIVFTSVKHAARDVADRGVPGLDETLAGLGLKRETYEVDVPGSYPDKGTDTAGLRRDDGPALSDSVVL
ncbi:hypothetical protein EW026_g793 [Hermanssonia centrifuga]|uniref:Uncharacterized protein n=1 Tax=Hermanssonia centrifuga TaxID=98765 RepID=A0A4S4KUL5_9APHY|nr:hypothetical protein EW026_g793 [Hermanssonia centrifuga]